MATNAVFNAGDWPSSSKAQPLTSDDLRRFSSADLDPYTVELAKVLCERFRFSQLGQRNLSDTLSSLWGQNHLHENFEQGFGVHHPVHTIVKSSSGFTLAALTRALAEYFDEDFVVQFFMVLAIRSAVRHPSRPLEQQWRRLERVMSGVLVMSSFGVVLSTFEDVCSFAYSSNPDPEKVLTGLDQMSALVSHREEAASLSLGPEMVWLASAAQWLFSLRMCIWAADSRELYQSAGVHSFNEASLVLHVLNTSVSSRTTLTGWSSSSPTNCVISGGRVAFEGLFRSCFGNAFTDIDKDVFAAYISCTSSVIHHLLSSKPGSADFFLSHASAQEGHQTQGLADTIIAWFPEVR